MKTVSRLFFVLACGTVLFTCIPGAFSTPSSPRTITDQMSPPPPVHLVKTDAPPARTVRNVRLGNHPTYTRVVLDMTGPVTVREAGDKTSARLTLVNSRLSSHAQQVIRSKTLPQVMTIAQGASDTVTVTLKLDALQKYTFHTYRNPHRVAVDLFYRNPHQVAVDLFHPPPFRLVIDPGHGGKDPGAIGKSGTQEKTVVLQIAKLVRDLVRKRPNATVFLTRSTDVFLDLKQRVQFAKDKHADLFLSIHANSHPKRSIQGVEIYHLGKASDSRALEVAARENDTVARFLQQNKDNPEIMKPVAAFLRGPKSSASRIFAAITKETLIPLLQTGYSVKVKTAPFHVLSWTSMPGILAEIGFISNPTEEKRLRNAAFQKKMAEGIYQSIRKCTQTLKPSPDSSCLLYDQSHNTP